MGNVVSQPSVSFTLVSADQDQSNAPQKVLMVGQMISGTSAGSGAWEQNLGNAGEENALFGRTSQLAGAVRAFKSIAPQVQLDAISLDAGSTARIVGIAVTGTATEAGTLFITVGSERLHRIAVAVADGDAAATVISAAVAAINLDADCQYTASVVSTVVTMTSDNNGALAQLDPIGHSGTVAGIALAAPVESVAGATDPTLTSILDVIGETRYQAIIWPYAIRSVLTDLLDARFNVTNNVLDGVGFTMSQDTKSNLVTELASLNSQSLVLFCDEPQSEAKYLGGSLAETQSDLLSYFVAIRGLRLTPDQAISQFVTSSAALDQFGGPALASLPYFNTPIPFVNVPAQGRGFTELEIEELFAAGGAIVGQNPAGSAVITGEVPTTYLTDGAGSQDITWKFLNYVDTSSGAREYLHNNVKARFAQSRLTNGQITPGRDMANALSIKSYLVQLYSDLAGDGFALVQGGPDAVDFFKENVTVTIDLSIGKATVTMLLPIMTQLRIIVASVKIDFSFGS
jgi:phage tail sheath gpL-like